MCALTLLLAATVAFHDTLVGTLLGDAVAVQVRATDYVAVGATVLLGAVGSLAGAGLGLAGVARFTDALPADLIVTTLAGLAALAPAAS
ncbi:MAG TPA: hypothetical protein VK631_04305, partial [Solirubrobacteraceae bacterium]|nr:hypothetical protein [Solirubrobacteraceae bacterium]